MVKFRSYKMFENGAIREFYSLLRAAMMGARKAGLLHRLVNDQTLPSILAKMPPNDWRQWAKERPTWMREAIEEAFWSFVDQKWRDALNVAAAEPAGWGTGSGKGAAHEGDGRGAAEAKKLAQAAVHVTGADGKCHQQGDSGRRCIFVDVMGCSGLHPPWHCKLFRKKRAKEREKIIEDNRLCPFCLLHDRARTCGEKERLANPACHIHGCKGRHIRKLHELLKDIHKEENQVHLVQGGDEWEEPEDAWEIDGEEEAMIVGSIQRKDDCSWQEACKSWLEQDGEEESGAYCFGTCQGVSNQLPEAGKSRSSGASCSLKEEEKDKEIIEDSWWSPDPGDLQIEEGEKDYFLELLIGGSAPGRSGGASERPSAANSKTSQPAKKEAAREGKPVTSKGKGRSSEVAPKGESESNTKTGIEGVGARNGEEPKEWRPSGRGQEVPPDLPGDPGPKDKVIQARAQPEAHEHEYK